MATTLGDLTTFDGVVRATGGLFPAANLTPAVGGGTPFYTHGGAPRTLTDGADQVPVSGTVYFAEVTIPYARVLKGGAFLPGSVGGTDSAIISLYDHNGILLAQTANAGTTVGSASTWQEINFTANYAAASGLYYVGVSVNGTTCRLRNGVSAGVRGSSNTGTFGTLVALTSLPTAGAASIIAAVF